MNLSPSVTPPPKKNIFFKLWWVQLINFLKNKSNFNLFQFVYLSISYGHSSHKCDGMVFFWTGSGVGSQRHCVTKALLLLLGLVLVVDGQNDLVHSSCFARIGAVPAHV